MQQLYFKFDTKKRLDEIMNALAVLDARMIELDNRFKRKGLSVSEYLLIEEELDNYHKQIQSYKEELDKIAKIELLRKSMLLGEL